MSVQVVVKSGPDAGRTYSLQAGVTNIGRGPSAQIRLGDPSLHGAISIDATGGVVRVRHDLPHQIYLNRQPFPPGEYRTWFHGHELQPTADTVLVMQLVGEQSDGKNSSKNTPWLMAAGMGMLAVVFFVTPSGGSTPDPEAKEKPEIVQAGLLKMAASRPTDPSVTVLPKLFAAARSQELRGRMGPAFDGYSRFRDALVHCEAKPRTGSSEMLTTEEEAALKAAKAMVNSRLIRLSRQKSRS